MLSLSYSQPPAPLHSSVFLFPLPSSIHSLPWPTTPEGFKVWAPGDLGMAHWNRRTRPTSLFTTGGMKEGRNLTEVIMVCGENADMLLFPGAKVKRTPRVKGRPFEIGFANVWIDGLIKSKDAFHNLPSGLLNLSEIGSTTLPVRE